MDKLEREEFELKGPITLVELIDKDGNVGKYFTGIHGRVIKIRVTYSKIGPIQEVPGY